MKTLAKLHSKNALLLFAAAGSAALLACGGSGGTEGSDVGSTNQAATGATSGVIDVTVEGLAAGLTIAVTSGITGDAVVDLGTATSPTAAQALVHKTSWGLPSTFAFDAALKGSFTAPVGTKFDVTVTAPTVATGSSVTKTAEKCAVKGGKGTVGTKASLVTVTCAISPVQGHSLFVTEASKDNVNVAGIFGTDPATGPFSFDRVFRQIVATGAADIGLTGADTVAPVSATVTAASTTEPVLTGGPGLYQQLIDTMNLQGTPQAVTKGPHCLTQNTSLTPSDTPTAIICPMEEGPIADQPNAGNTYNGFTPIALVNRFDTVTAGSLNCGQHRVVFALPPAVAAATGDVNRFLMIFEAVLPNPDPTGNPASCLAVTQFWDDLSSPLLTDANRVAMLESFYFDGITGKDAEGKDLNFQPVVMAQHYGINSQNDSTDTGQIRVNMLEPTTFPQLTDWDLREFRLSQTCTAEGDAGLKCTVTANNTVVQNNPAAALFAATGAQLSSFQTAFLGQLPSLAATSVAGISWEIPQADDSIDSIELWANIAVFFRNNDYTLQALSPQFSSAISKALVPINTKLGLTGANALTVTDMVNRAETQSCAGCHEVVQANGSAEAVLGGGLPNWPSSNGFTQISELGPNADTGTFGVPTLSPALTGTFLPARGQNLVTFLQDNGGI